MCVWKRYCLLPSIVHLCCVWLWYMYLEQIEYKHKLIFSAFCLTLMFAMCMQKRFQDRSQKQIMTDAVSKKWVVTKAMSLVQGIRGVFDDFKQHKRNKMNEGSASGCPLPASYGPAYRCEGFLWILTLFFYHWPFVAMFFKLFTRCRSRDCGAKKVGRNPMYDFFPLL